MKKSKGSPEKQETKKAKKNNIEILESTHMRRVRLKKPLTNMRATLTEPITVNLQINANDFKANKKNHKRKASSPSKLN